PGEALGRLVGLDTYWVVATVPQSRLRWLRFAGDGAEPSTVRIQHRTAWEPGQERTGTLHRLVGALEGRTRLARVIVEVPDPLAYRADAGPPLMIGAFVEVLIEAEELRDVIRVHRDHVRDDDTVWVMEDGVLRIRDVGVAFRDATYAYIDAGLAAGDRVVTTDLSTVVDGAPLRLASDDSVPEAEATPVPGE
ncbi:MAG: HlyD family efflux transporter periplasmic adaptor subunit, partial [Gemmatimonadota bacterium]